MKILIILLLSFSGISHAQVENHSDESQLEDLSEEQEVEPEDEYNAQELQAFQKDPVNLNDAERIADFPLISAAQSENLIRYRQAMGDLVSVYELQAVPGFDPEFIRSILLYITVRPSQSIADNLYQRLRNGHHSIMFRPTLASKTLFRYRYQNREKLQYGLLTEKDAAEHSFTDFYSFHLQFRDRGLVKSLILGDYSLNIGQGLIHWQSQAFRKSASVLAIMREAETIRPYQSSGEYNFQRGIATAIGTKRFIATVFFSSRKLDGNIDSTLMQPLVTSINSSGLHVTKSERARKGNLDLITYGLNFRYGHEQRHVAITAINYQYSLPTSKRPDPYNRFALQGRSFSRFGADYSVTISNLHLFGELALANTGATAVLAGLLASLDKNADLSLVVRNIARNYQSLYGNAFTENTMPSNEQGCYAGLSLRPTSVWRIDTYFDVFRFPWLKYRVDAPSAGYQCLAQLTWKPSRTIEVYSRFRVRSKPLNSSDGIFNDPGQTDQKNFRAQASMRLNSSVTFRSRVELCWFRAGGGPTSAGQLLFFDLIYKPMGKWYSGNARFQSFEIDSYDARIYAYENDVLFVSSIPLVTGSGWRTYFNFRAKFKWSFFVRSAVDACVKLAYTHYLDPPSVMSRAGPVLRFQLLFHFV